MKGLQTPINDGEEASVWSFMQSDLQVIAFSSDLIKVFYKASLDAHGACVSNESRQDMEPARQIQGLSSLYQRFNTKVFIINTIKYLKKQNTKGKCRPWQTAKLHLLDTNNMEPNDFNFKSSIIQQSKC